jgi:tetratricopeptide (TPR) repeat protein
MNAQILMAAVAIATAGLHAEAQIDPPSAPQAAEEDVQGCIQDENVLLRIESCTRVIKSGGLEGPALAWAYNNRGLAYEQLRRPERALEDYNTAVLLDPDFAVGFNNRGNVLAMMGDLEGAVADHTRAIEIDPEYSDAYFNRGRDFEELGDPEAAVRDYARALEADPDYVLARLSRAAAHCDLGNVDEAVADQLALLEIGHFTAEQMQEFLKSREFYTGPIDGIFGQGSRAALRAWAEAGCP